MPPTDARERAPVRRAPSRLAVCLVALALVSGPASGAAEPARNEGDGGSRAAPGEFRPQFLPSLSVPRLEGEIRIDGELGDHAWDGAARVTGFAEVDPGDQIRPPVESEVWIGYDDANLYLALLASDDPRAVRVGLRDRDRIWSDDYFGIMLDTYGDHAWGYEFFVNPLGIQGDLRIGSNGNDDLSPNYIWRSSGRLNDHGWQAEIAIPFASLRFPETAEQVWRANFWRDHQRDVRRRYAWAATDRDNPCWMCQWGTLTGIRGVRPSREFHVVASAIGYRDGARDHTAGDLRMEDPHGEAGASLRYAFTSTSTAEATFNPDFSQIESDAARIDVNEPYALYYDERRPFFQEGIELYRTPITAIYTRSIHDPSAAGKLLGTFGGTAVAWTGARDDAAPILLPLEERSFLLPGDAAWSNLVRARQALGDDSYVGLVATDRRYEGGGGNTVTGLDGSLRFRRNWRLSFQALQSRTLEPRDSARTEGLEGLTFGRGGRRHTLVFDGERFDGAAGYVAAEYGGRTGSVSLEGATYAPSFRADQGFVTRTDQQSLHLWSGLSFRPNGRWLVSWQPSVSAGRLWDHAGRFQDEWLSPEVEWSTRAQTTLAVQGMWSRERFREALLPGIRRATFEAGTRPWDALGGEASLSFMRTIYRTFDPTERPFVGVGMRAGLEAEVKVGHRLQLAPGLGYERLRKPAGPGVASRLLYDGWILRNRLDLQISRETSLRLISEYDKFDRALRIEPLLTYRVNALSVVYVGMADRYDRLSSPGTEESLMDARDGEAWRARARDAAGGGAASRATPHRWELGATQVFAKVQYLFRV